MYKKAAFGTGPSRSSRLTTGRWQLLLLLVPSLPPSLSTESTFPELRMTVDSASVFEVKVAILTTWHVAVAGWMYGAPLCAAPPACYYSRSIVSRHAIIMPE